MKGRKTFTYSEAEHIRQLIRQKVVAEKSTQKKIRAEIRALGFYITDFTRRKKYTEEDFDRYVTVVAV